MVLSTEMTYTVGSYFCLRIPVGVPIVGIGSKKAGSKFTKLLAHVISKAFVSWCLGNHFFFPPLFDRNELRTGGSQSRTVLAEYLRANSFVNIFPATSPHCTSGAEL